MSGVQEFEHLPVFVDDDHAASRRRRVAIRGGARLPKPREADPVFGRPALETRVGCEHGRGASIAARMLWAIGGVIIIGGSAWLFAAAAFAVLSTMALRMALLREVA